MSLIICAVYDTEKNGRSEYTERTLESLFKTVEWSRHRLIVVDNASCERTKVFLSSGDWYTLITNTENVGTARAINQGLALRQPGEHCIKVDNDVVIHQSGWVEQMEQAIERDTSIGIIGLKRKDVDFDANHENIDYRSELVQLPHSPGQTWITVEKGPSIMGTCTMFNPKLLDTIGGFQDCSVYGFDDSLISLRSILSGFWNCYLPHIEIEHIDDGSNPYTQEKQRIASEAWSKYNAMHEGYINGTLPLFVEI